MFPNVLWSLWINLYRAFSRHSILSTTRSTLSRQNQLKMASSPKSATKASINEQYNLEETRKMESKRKHVPGMEELENAMQDVVAENVIFPGEIGREIRRLSSQGTMICR
ncbi:uncharacterized protein LOC131216987 [Magnolia sinica]|uniref:uncharacterized protein LOC131216987 n=1 Tax=Magnolia sinica TaxID=86752 RepID=UPI00265A987D|nr:uncharacterized protein LOC131216987 [Magnolia sinica]